MAKTFGKTVCTLQTEFTVWVEKREKRWGAQKRGCDGGKNSLGGGMDYSFHKEYKGRVL